LVAISNHKKENLEQIFRHTDYLKALERMAGRARKDLKSKSSQPRKSNSSYSEATSKLLKTSESLSKTVSTTDSSFPRLVFKNSVLDLLNSAPPENLGYLQDRLNRARDMNRQLSQNTRILSIGHKKLPINRLCYLRHPSYSKNTDEDAVQCITKHLTTSQRA
jgi:hypothetical protein